MSNVYDIFTGKQVESLPFSKKDGETMIENLLSFELNRSTNPDAPDCEMVAQLVSWVENNTGASRYDVMDTIYARKMGYENV